MRETALGQRLRAQRMQWRARGQRSAEPSKDLLPSEEIDILERWLTELGDEGHAGHHRAGIVLLHPRARRRPE